MSLGRFVIVTHRLCNFKHNQEDMHTKKLRGSIDLVETIQYAYGVPNAVQE